jgi:hypothetical protein
MGLIRQRLGAVVGMTSLQTTRRRRAEPISRADEAADEVGIAGELLS